MFCYTAYDCVQLSEKKKLIPDLITLFCFESGWFFSTKGIINWVETLRNDFYGIYIIVKTIVYTNKFVPKLHRYH